MMLLGRLIKLAMTAQSDFPVDVANREPQLAKEIEAEAGRAGMNVPQFIADTISRFMAHEDSESWTTIIGNIQRSDDPGFAFISTVMRARLDHRCDQHS